MISDEAARRRARFAKFASTADIVPEHPDYAKITEGLRRGRNPELDRRVKAQWQRAKMLLSAFQLNGPSLFVDKYLRNFLAEYNNRVFVGRGNEQPTSFNIVRACLTPDEQAFVLKLSKEKFYQFNLLDYLEYLTTDAPDSVRVNDFEELTIYELNNAGSFSKVVLPGFDDLVFCGASVVREADEFSVIGIFGNHRSQFVEGPAVQPDEIAIKKREFIGEGPWDTSAERLFDNDDYYPLLAMTRIDAKARRIQARYVMHESKGLFRVTTDDPTVMLEPEFFRPGVDINAAFKRAIDELARYRHVFNLLNNFLHFQNFFAKREDDFYIERHPTQLKTGPQTTFIRKLRGALEAQYIPNYREVMTLAQSTNAASSTIDRMDLKFETSGYWRTIELDKVGADKSGNQIHGKTWVEQRLSWIEAEIASAAENDQTEVARVAREEDIGYIYVMRSPVHLKNVFKVGFTTRDPEDRANDLSSTSGQPDPLVVMQSWRVFEPRRVEQQIHRQLQVQRINSRREFFKANFEMIRRTIENVIENLTASAPTP